MGDKIYITLPQYTMGRDKECAEWINTVQDNAKVLLQRVNAFLNEITLRDAYIVTSGFRPSYINKQVKNAAKASNHMRGKAVDILDDKEQTLGNFCLNHLDLLEKYGLWLESPKFTIGQHTNWVHLQSEAPGSGNRVFIP
jgi:hypothetical protein